MLYGLDLPDANLIKQLEAKLITFSSDHGWYQHEGANVGSSLDIVANTTSSQTVNSNLPRNDVVGGSLPSLVGSSLAQNNTI